MIKVKENVLFDNLSDNFKKILSQAGFGPGENLTDFLNDLLDEKNATVDDYLCKDEYDFGDKILDFKSLINSNSCLYEYKIIGNKFDEKVSNSTIKYLNDIKIILNPEFKNNTKCKKNAKYIKTKNSNGFSLKGIKEYNCAIERGMGYV